MRRPFAKRGFPRKGGQREPDIKIIQKQDAKGKVFFRCGDQVLIHEGHEGTRSNATTKRTKHTQARFFSHRLPEEV
ncbi:hypothetical protein SE18_14655 [Herpetosiphon geysericola]|uniref:Uncharacterized protein n=1 Tax=Herpetosiphon geysericola TaxID=70996 RepID=A0A0P6XQB0_9CHLR|nr:hypothetical protein SE18_14655 [Herpetosiphon geysericola]